MTFSEYITQKYIKWRGDEKGNRKSIARYAKDELGITPQLLSEWMNRGKLPTDAQYVDLLFKKFGEEVFEFLPSDAQLLPIAELILQLPAEERPAARQMLIDLLEEIVRKTNK